MAIRTELNLRLPNSPGALAGVCRLMSDERVNITAISLDSAGHLRMVVDNHVHGAAVLREHHHQVTERDVLLMALANTPGALSTPLVFVAEAGINIEYAYGGAHEAGTTGTVVLGVENALRASAATGI